MATDIIDGAADEANAVILQGDGRIIAGGSSPSGLGADFGLVRYNGDGSLDARFGAGGIVHTDFGATDFFGSSLAIQQDGRILAAGSSDAAGTNDFALARYGVDGTPDATFGTAGKVLTDFGGADVGSSLAIQHNGRIVAAGSFFFCSTGGFALARYNP